MLVWARVHVKAGVDQLMHAGCITYTGWIEHPGGLGYTAVADCIIPKAIMAARDCGID